MGVPRIEPRYTPCRVCGLLRARPYGMQPIDRDWFCEYHRGDWVDPVGEPA